MTEEVSQYYVRKDARVLDPKLLEMTLLERMPSPTGWRLLVLPYHGKATTDGGIVLTDQTIERNQLSTVCAYVLKVGPLAYQDTTKFPSGAWCKQGDWILFPRYAGSRFRIEGGEVRILNDDEVLGTVADPDDILSL